MLCTIWKTNIYRRPLFTNKRYVMLCSYTILYFNARFILIFYVHFVFLWVSSTSIYFKYQFDNMKSGPFFSNFLIGGDYNDQFHDSEIDSIPPNVYVRPSDVCPNQPLLATYTDAVKSGSVSRVTLFISNGHVRITNSNGLNQKLCDQCLFALNGQADPSYGGANEDIYIALNRVITGRSDRYGVGVCSAKLSWVCPEFF